MLTSKQRAELRAEANTLETTLMVGKGGVTEQVLSEARTQLEARELVKGRVLETALLSAREASDAICTGIGAEGIACVGSKFVIYRRSEKKAQEAAQKARAEKKKHSNPVRPGRHARSASAATSSSVSPRSRRRSRSASSRRTKRNKKQRKGGATWHASAFSAEALIRRISDTAWRSVNFKSF